MSWSLVTLSGRFCKNRILLGGRYSSGIWTAGRLGAGAEVTPATFKGVNQGSSRPNGILTSCGCKPLSAKFLLEGISIAGGLYAIQLKKSM